MNPVPTPQTKAIAPILEDVELEVGEVPFDGTPPPCEICSEAEANTFLRRKRQIEDDRATIKLQSEKMLAELNRREKQLDYFWLHRVRVFAVNESLKRGKQTIQLFFGTLAFRKSKGGKLRFDSEKLEAAEDYAKAQGVIGDLATYKLSKSAYLEWAQEQMEKTGELVPGVELTEEDTSFSVSFPNKNKASE